MPRIAGIDIPDNKPIRYALRYIYGVGPKHADTILTECNIDPKTRARDLDDHQVSAINTVIDGNFLVEGALRRQVNQNIQRLRDIRSYKGDRHRRGLPVHGQRTRCNARTRKGRKKTVAGKKGVKGR
jgi:small subunit ribosomal protein S13